MEPLTIDTLTQAPRGIRNLLAELKIHCEFFERGCGKFVQLEHLERHVNDCGFAPAVCSACQLEVNKRDLVHHETAMCEVRRLKCPSCNEIRQDMDIVKFNLAAINEKLYNNEKMNLKAVKQLNLELNNQGDSIRHVQGDIVEMKKCLNKITKQLARMTQQASHKVQDEQEEMKKGIAEADEMDTDPKVVIAGGENNGVELNSVEMFSLSTQTWTPLQPMKECRGGASSVVYNNQVVVTGGLDNDGRTKSMERLSTNAVHADQSITWKKHTAELPGHLEGHCSVVYNGRLIVIGGYDADKGVCSVGITEVSLVPPCTTKLLATMPQARWYHSVAIFGDKIIIFGGRHHVLFTDSLRSVLMYDITKNVCKELAPLPYPVSEMATVKWGDDNVMIIGGADSDYEPLNKVSLYNIKTQKSHMLPDMKYKRQGCVAAVVRDTVIVMGGQDEGGNFLTSVESFTFNHYGWDELPQMHEPRSWATAVAC